MTNERKNRRLAKTEWGLMINDFLRRYGLTLTELARMTGVKYHTILAIQVNRTPGIFAVPKINAFIEEYVKTHAECVNASDSDVIQEIE